MNIAHIMNYPHIHLNDAAALVLTAIALAAYAVLIIVNKKGPKQ